MEQARMWWYWACDGHFQTHEARGRRGRTQTWERGSELWWEGGGNMMYVDDAQDGESKDHPNCDRYHQKISDL